MLCLPLIQTTHFLMDLLFLKKLVSAEIDYSDLLLQLDFRIPRRHTRHNELFSRGFHHKKEGKPDNLPTSFRPLCLLDTLRKLLEHLLHGRLMADIELSGELAKNQFGFRAGRSTVDVVQGVMRLVDRAANGTLNTRRIPAVITLDIRNAFNSASWQVILEALARRGISPYLLRIIQQYLRDRKMMIMYERGSEELEATRVGSRTNPVECTSRCSPPPYASLWLLAYGLR